MTGNAQALITDVSGVRLDQCHIYRDSTLCLERARGRHSGRKTEIQHLHVAVEAHHDVFRLQIAMDDARTMRGAKGLEHLPGNLEASLDWKRAPEPLAQGLSLHQLRHQVVGTNIV